MKRLALLSALLLYALPAAATNPPRVMFTDLDSGPKTGGENGNGTILTIYGKGFGSSQGGSTVTVGGGAPAAYLRWCAGCSPGSLWDMVSVAVGASAATGAVVVTVGGQPSNSDVTFTVRSGNIYCVSTTGNNGNAGTFPASCWATIPKVRTTIAAGDIAYVLTGVSATVEDDYSAAFAISTTGTSGSPKALVAYPAATVTVGTDAIGYAIRTPSIAGGPFQYWTIAGLTMKGRIGLDLTHDADYWRFVGNDVSCINGGGSSACLHFEVGTNEKVWGNYVHNVGTNCGSDCKLYHAIYYTTDSNHEDVGWNLVDPDPSHTGVAGCRGIQFNSTGSAPQFDLHVHDNLVRNTICDGINFATVDPSKGVVEAYNNIVYHAGTGPDPSGQQSNYTCIVSLGAIEAGPAGSGTVAVYNNTLYDCGQGAIAGGNGTGGALGSFNDGAGLSMVAKSNVIYLTAGQFYFETGANNNLACDRNDWFGVGAAPGACTNNLNTDPLFTNLGTKDFHLTAPSPVISQGFNSGIATDFDGVARPAPATLVDEGAYQFAAGAGAPIVSLSPGTLTFGNQIVSTTSSPQTITLSNIGSAILTITSIVASGDFAKQSTTCGGTLAAGNSCTISTTFTPTTTGARSGAMTFTDDASNSPQAVTLSGTGIPAPATNLTIGGGIIVKGGIIFH